MCPFPAPDWGQAGNCPQRARGTHFKSGRVGALNAQLRGLAPTQSRNPSAEITCECFLTAVSGAVFSCESSGGAAAELRNSKASSSVMAEDVGGLCWWTRVCW